MQEMQVSKPINLDQVSVEIFQLSFVISNVIQEILKQAIFVLREKADKIHRWKHKNPTLIQLLNFSWISWLKAAHVFSHYER